MDASPVAGVEVPRVRAVNPGIFTEDTPATPRWQCWHCRTVTLGRVLASFNGAPLCSMDCYRLVKEYDHQMPCGEDPCPGEVVMGHDH